MTDLFSKVSTIFKERYGANLLIEDKIGTNPGQAQFSSRWPSPFVYSRTRQEVRFPIFNSKRELQAIATAQPVDNKDAIIFDEMSQFLQLTIAEHYELTTQLDTKIQTEIAIEQAHADTKKVLQLKTKKGESMTGPEMKKRSFSREPDLRPLWITGDDNHLLNHIAFSVHDWTANWAFINAKEIPDLIWEDTSYWSHFPKITIYIPNVTELSKDKLEKLNSNLGKLKTMEGPKPFVLVTSKTEIPDELIELKSLFKSYRANKNNKPQVQAHFLLYHHQEEKNGVHFCKESKDLFFLPFSPTTDKLH